MFLRPCSYLKNSFRCFRTAVTVGASDKEKIHLVQIYVQIVRSYIQCNYSRLLLTSYKQDRSDCILGRFLTSLELKVVFAKYWISFKVIFIAIEQLLNSCNAYFSVSPSPPPPPPSVFPVCWCSLNNSKTVKAVTLAFHSIQ